MVEAELWAITHSLARIIACVVHPFQLDQNPNSIVNPFARNHIHQLISVDFYYVLLFYIGMSVNLQEKIG